MDTNLLISFKKCGQFYLVQETVELFYIQLGYKKAPLTSLILEKKKSSIPGMSKG